MTYPTTAGYAKGSKTSWDASKALEPTRQNKCDSILEVIRDEKRDELSEKRQENYNLILIGQLLFYQSESQKEQDND